MYETLRAQKPVTSIHASCFVKENCILIRWVPENKQLFDLAVKNGYKITRQALNEGKTINEIVLAENVRPIPQTDSLTWVNLMKENKNSILVFKTFYENKTSATLSVKEKEKQEKMLYHLMLLSCNFDSRLAASAGLFLTDSTINNKTCYRYKIEINSAPKNANYSPTTFTVNASELSKNPKINGLNGKFKNKTVQLKWHATPFVNNYAGYAIERSLDSLEFVRVNAAPVILLTSSYEKNKEHIFYTDTLPSLKKRYYYRIRGINYFGELSLPSNTISGEGFEELKTAPYIDSVKIISDQGIYVAWQLKNKNEIARVKKYVLLRSQNDQGPYLAIHEANQNEFAFTDKNPNYANYYKIAAVSFNDDTLYSFSRLVLIPDTVPPEKPKGLKATVDKSGALILTWENNSENDLQGYKVFKSNALHEEFTQVSNKFIQNPEFNDKLNLNTLSKSVFYAVVATDKNYNNSPLSEPLEVKRPDTIAPVAPIITELKIKDKGIVVSWIKSSSNDVKLYALYRKDEKNLKQEKIKEWQQNDTTTSCVDSLAETGQGYYYYLMAIDESNNTSVSNSPYIKYETGFRKKINDFSFVVDRNKKVIRLFWKYEEPEIDKYIIYRAGKKEALTIIKTLAHPANTYEDKYPNIGNTYYYRIKAVYNNGAESIISDAIEAEY